MRSPSAYQRICGCPADGETGAGPQLQHLVDARRARDGRGDVGLQRAAGDRGVAAVVTTPGTKPRVVAVTRTESRLRRCARVGVKDLSGGAGDRVTAGEPLHRDGRVGLSSGRPTTVSGVADRGRAGRSSGAVVARTSRSLKWMKPEGQPVPRW